MLLLASFDAGEQILDVGGHNSLSDAEVDVGDDDNAEAERQVGVEGAEHKPVVKPQLVVS